MTTHLFQNCKLLQLEALLISGSNYNISTGEVYSFDINGNERLRIADTYSLLTGELTVYGDIKTNDKYKYIRANGIKSVDAYGGVLISDAVLIKEDRIMFQPWINLTSDLSNGMYASNCIQFDGQNGSGGPGGFKLLLNSHLGGE